jgi:hypothetical protein
MRLIRTIAPLAPLALTVLAACQDAAPPTSADAGPSLLAAATHVEDVFFATAACQADIGFDIRFGGPRVLVRHVSGTDTTLSFRTQDFQGWRLPETTFDGTTVDYAVLGGAEMFNIKRADDGTLVVRIHEGTLVFESFAGSERIIARHVIRTVPGQGPVVNGWSCRRIG